MSIFDLIFPVKCLECGCPGKYMCSKCLAEVEMVRQVKTPDLVNVISVWEYRGVVRQAILALKYKFAFEIARELADRFVESYRRLQLTSLDNPVLVPVPIHWRRENWRGFNQSAEIGKIVANKLGWGFNPNLLIKIKSTVSQTELSRSQRLSSPSGSFFLNPNHSLVSSIKYLVLFDDVYTTGATLSAAARTLKTAGIEKVWGMTLAR